MNDETTQPQNYRKKPVVVQAVVFDGSNHREVAAFLGNRNYRSFIPGKYFIETLEGIMTALPGDYIIRGVKGEYYPCKPDIFEVTYERAD